jgi:hypothetical protein
VDELLKLLAWFTEDEDILNVQPQGLAPQLSPIQVQLQVTDFPLYDLNRQPQGD